MGVSLGLKSVGERGFAVVTLDETTGSLLTREQFEHISWQIRGFVEKKGCLHTDFLYLLISEEEESQRRLFAGGGNCWRIIPTQGRVMVYEDTPPQFLELRMPLEALFPSGNRSQYSGSGYVGNNGGYTEGPAFSGASGGSRERMAGYWHKKGFPKCNIVIVLLNIIIFLVCDLLLFSSRDVLVEWGALGWYEVLKEGQWYRLITSIFMHGGIEHIFSNMLVLIYLGSFLEQQIGSLRYGIIYLGAGLLAGFTSMGYNMILGDYTVSIGASGAVFGVMGALLCLVLLYREKAGDFNFRQVAVMVFFGLYGGFTGQGVDNAAHVGGLIAGFLLTVLIMLPGRQTKSRN